MMLDPVPPGTDAPSYLSAKGMNAVAMGDIALGRRYHRAAGAALAAEMAAVHPARGRHTLRFQVATQYFKAGDYPRAKRLAAAVDPGELPSSIRPVFDQFWLDCQARTRPGYAASVRRAIQECYPRNEWKRALELLASHPYVIEPVGVAYMRAICLENMGKYRAAAHWFAKTVGDPRLMAGVLGAATVPDWLVAEGRWADAEAYAVALVEAIPHPFVLASASYAFYRLIRRPGVGHEGRTAYAKKQLELIDRSTADKFTLPPGGDHEMFVKSLAVPLAAAAETMYNFGRPAGAGVLLEEAQRFDPDFGGRAARVMRQQWAERGLGDVPEEAPAEAYPEAAPPVGMPEPPQQRPRRPQWQSFFQNTAA
jgi:tetratricopeptide (TPR) repeat protein